MLVRVWDKSHGLTETLSRGRYRLVFDFPDYTPESVIDRLRGINRELSIFGKTIIIEGTSADYAKRIARIDLEIIDNPIPVLVIYGALIVAIGISAWLTLRAIYKIVALPFEKPIVGIGILAVIALFAVRGLKR